jgi:hypothetical protein
MPGHITDATLLSLFKASPLSRRTIRRRLGRPANSVVSAVLHSACKRGILHRVKPEDVGSSCSFVHVYAPNSL